MSYPPDVSTRIVFGKYTKVSGTAASGTITFTASNRIEDADDAVILSGPLSINLDTDGEFSVELPCTDDRDLSPRGWYYTARVRIRGARPYDFRFYLPEGDGEPIDITRLDTADPSAISPSGTEIARGPVGPQGPTGPADCAGAGD